MTKYLVPALFLVSLTHCACGHQSRDATPADPPMSDMGTLSPQLQSSDSGAVEFFLRQGPSSTDNVILIGIRNLGEVPLWINARMRVADRSSPFAEVWLEITDAKTGHALEFGCRAGGGYAAPQDYVRLGPMSEVLVARPLHCFSFAGPGPWRVVAHYRDPSRRVQAPPRGAKWFSGILVSKEIEFSASASSQVDPSDSGLD